MVHTNVNGKHAYCFTHAFGGADVLFLVLVLAPTLVIVFGSVVGLIMSAEQVCTKTRVSRFSVWHSGGYQTVLETRSDRTLLVIHLPNTCSPSPRAHLRPNHPANH